MIGEEWSRGGCGAGQGRVGQGRTGQRQGRGGEGREGWGREGWGREGWSREGWGRGGWGREGWGREEWGRAGHGAGEGREGWGRAWGRGRGGQGRAGRATERVGCSAWFVALGFFRGGLLIPHLSQMYGLRGGGAKECAEEQGSGSRDLDWPEKKDLWGEGWRGRIEGCVGTWVRVGQNSMNTWNGGCEVRGVRTWVRGGDMGEGWGHG